MGTTNRTTKGKRRTTRRGVEKPAEDRADLYQEITDQIIAELEAGTVPWAQPWDSNVALDTAEATFALPQNGATGRTYSGVNILILWLHATSQGFAGQRWITFAQAKALGAHVRKGERSVRVVHAGTFTPKEEREAAAAEGRDERAMRYLKAHRVFHVSQIDGLPEEVAHRPAPVVPSFEGVDAQVRRIIERSRTRFVMGSAQAYYQPSTDVVSIPLVEAFYEPIDWHRTALHELSHMTGHSSRLDRDLGGFGGSRADYAREELVAEMGAAFTCASLGIRPIVRHADYLATWLAVLKEDKCAIVRAASAASKASDFLLAFADSQEEEQTADAEPAPIYAPFPHMDHAA